MFAAQGRNVYRFLNGKICEFQKGGGRGYNFGLKYRPIAIILTSLRILENDIRQKFLIIASKSCQNGVFSFGPKKFHPLCNSPIMFHPKIFHPIENSQIYFWQIPQLESTYLTFYIICPILFSQINYSPNTHFTNKFFKP